jgi:Na+/melibiose symporter-like transporter
MDVFWLTSQGVWNAIYILIALSAGFVSPTYKILLVGAATAMGGVLAVTVPIAAGALSDRTRSRFGPRLPWIAGGTLVTVAGLVALALAHSVPALLGGYLLFQLGNNASGAAFASIIPDQVAARRRATASALLNSAGIAGIIGYLLLTLAVFKRLGNGEGAASTGYLLMAVAVGAGLAIALPFIGWRRAAVQTRDVSADKHLPVQKLMAPIRDPQFRWVLLTRLFQTLGIWTILPFLTYYFQDVTHAANPAASSALWQLAVLGGGIIPAMFCGYLSDRIGRRKPFIYISSGLQAAAAAVLLVTLVSDLRLIYLLGVVFGIGYGAYIAVDWALACDTLPQARIWAARDMGVFHASYTLPQVLGPALLAPALYWLNAPGSNIAGISTGGNLGFRAVFASAALWFGLATVMTRRIRGVR